MKISKTSFYKSKRFFIAATVVALLIIGGVALAVAARNDQDQTSTPNPAPPSDAPYDLNPATDEEKSESDKHKEDLANPQPQPSPQSGQKKQVSVIITSANAGSLNAYVQGVLEDGGTCTATFTKGSQQVSRTSQGFSNVSVTNCQPISPSLSSSGTWAVTVKYSSQAAEGSAQTTVEVP